MKNNESAKSEYRPAWERLHAAFELTRRDTRKGQIARRMLRQTGNRSGFPQWGVA